MHQLSLKVIFLGVFLVGIQLAESNQENEVKISKRECPWITLNKLKARWNACGKPGDEPVIKDVYWASKKAELIARLEAAEANKNTSSANAVAVLEELKKVWEDLAKELAAATSNKKLAQIVLSAIA